MSTFQDMFTANSGTTNKTSDTDTSLSTSPKVPAFSESTELFNNSETSPKSFQIDNSTRNSEESESKPMGDDQIPSELTDDVNTLDDNVNTMPTSSSSPSSPPSYDDLNTTPTTIPTTEPLKSDDVYEAPNLYNNMSPSSTRKRSLKRRRTRRTLSSRCKLMCTRKMVVCKKKKRRKSKKSKSKSKRYR